MRSLALAAAAIAAAPAAQAQAYPAKPVRLIVPYPAGGATDFFARTVFTKMSESLGQQVVVENRPGAGTAIGASEVEEHAGWLHAAAGRRRDVCLQSDSVQEAF